MTSESGKKHVEERLAHFGIVCSEIHVAPSRGRDIGPLFTGFAHIFDAGYDVIGHVHGKKSVNLDSQFANQWASFLYDNLLGGAVPMMETILNRMHADPTIGLVFPDDPHVVGWEENWSHAAELAERMGVMKFLHQGSINFPVGTMFWARSLALKPFCKLNLQWEDYPAEPLPDDGSMLHAMERLLPPACESQGFRTAVTHTRGVIR